MGQSREITCAVGFGPWLQHPGFSLKFVGSYAERDRNSEAECLNPLSHACLPFNPKTRIRSFMGFGPGDSSVHDEDGWRESDVDKSGRRQGIIKFKVGRQVVRYNNG